MSALAKSFDLDEIMAATNPDYRFSKTKIIATIGPACETREKLKALVDAGVDIFRLNFAHGKHDWLHGPNHGEPWIQKSLQPATVMLT